LALREDKLLLLGYNNDQEFKDVILAFDRKTLQTYEQSKLQQTRDSREFYDSKNK
jgi:hypothetical protein